MYGEYFVVPDTIVTDYEYLEIFPTLK